MRLVTFEAGQGPRLGALTPDDRVVDLADAALDSESGADASFASMQALIEGGVAALDRARSLFPQAYDDAVALESVTLLSPLLVPVQMRDFLCFEEHMRAASFSAMKMRAMVQGGKAAVAAVEASGPPPVNPVFFQQPIYYKCNRFAVAGTGADVHVPAYSQLPDYELELAAVIGIGGRDISAANAPAHVFGYTILNDFTARDAQMAEMGGMLGPAKGKDFDGASILGPCIVTADELPDPHALRMRAWVNGELWSDGHSGTIHWTFAQMIEHVSRGETLHPGEVLGSGTVGGGCGLEFMRFLTDGDLVELEIEGIGRLSNRIRAPHLAAAGSVGEAVRETAHV